MVSSHIGPYAIRGELARGGMGVVYRAFDPQLNRDVAIKVLSALGGASEAETRRFHEEARLTARLHHPNIVGLHSAGSAHGQPYLVMDLIEGRSLHQRIKHEGPLDPHEAAEIVQALAGAVQYAHEQGVLHRDIKPQNVLLDRGGRPCLADFGVARLVERDERITRTGELIGTPYYIAPEQAAGLPDKIGPRSDVYSLGATLFEMLCGEPPFRGESVVETLTAVVTLPPQRPSELRPELDATIKQITMRCLEKDPDQRFASAADLQAQLADYLANPPEPEDERPSRAAPLLIGLALGAALFLPLGALLAPRAAAPEPPPTAAAEAPSGEAELALGRAFLVRQDPAAAGPCFERLIERDPGDARALAHLARVRIQQGRLDEAEDLLGRARRLAPERAEVLVAAGALQLQRGDLPGAQTSYAQAVKADASLPDAWNGLGSLKSRTDPVLGIPDFTRAIELDPDYVSAWLNRAKTRARSADHVGALADVEEAIRRHTTSPAAHYVKGQVLALLGRGSDAIAAYRETTRLDPLHVDAYLRRAEQYRKLHRPAEALPEYSRAAAIDAARRPRILVDRGMTHLERKDREAALRDFGEAIALKPDYVNALVNRGNVHGMLGSPRLALADYEAAIKVDPRQPLALLNRGRYHLQSDPEAAQRDFDVVLQDDPDHRLALLSRAQVHRQVGRTQAALTDLNHLIKVHGKRSGAQAFILRGQVHTLRRDVEAALADLKEAERLLPPNSRDLARVRFAIEKLEQSR